MYEFELAIAAIIISIVTAAFAYKTCPIESKQLRLTVLSQIYAALNNEEQTKTRGTIFRYYCARLKDAQGKLDVVFQPGGVYDDYARKVPGVFDAVSVLVTKELAEPELFFDLYAGMVVRVAKALDEHIQGEIKVNPEYCKWFRELNEKCKSTTLTRTTLCQKSIVRIHNLAMS